MHAETIAAWRQWLIDNHQATDGVWLVSWKTATGKSRIGYEESVVEALAVGWVDSIARHDRRRAQHVWFARASPPAPGRGRTRSGSTGSNGRAGCCRPAGRGRGGARPTAPGQLLDDFENLVVPDDLALAFDAVPRRAGAMGRVSPVGAAGHPGLDRAWPRRPRRGRSGSPRRRSRRRAANGRTNGRERDAVLGAAAGAVLPVDRGCGPGGRCSGVFSRAVIIGLHTESGPRVVSLLARGRRSVPNGVRLAGADLSGGAGRRAGADRRRPGPGRRARGPRLSGRGAPGCR